MGSQRWINARSSLWVHVRDERDPLGALLLAVDDIAVNRDLVSVLVHDPDVAGAGRNRPALRPFRVHAHERQIEHQFGYFGCVCGHLSRGARARSAALKPPTWYASSASPSRRSARACCAGNPLTFWPASFHREKECELMMSAAVSWPGAVDPCVDCMFSASSSARPKFVGDIQHVGRRRRCWWSIRAAMTWVVILLDGYPWKARWRRVGPR